MAETATHLDPKIAVQKLKQQNENLKSELSQLRGALQTAMNNQKQASIQAQRPNFSSDSEDRELQILHSKIKKLKNERSSLKVQITANSDSSTAEIENELKYLKNQLKQAEAEQQTLLKLQKDQENHIETISTGQTVADKISRLREEIKEAKDEYREVNETMKSEEARWLEDHKRMIALESRIREASGKTPKVKSKTQEEDELTELKRKQDVLNKAIATEEAKGKRYIIEAENSLKALQDEDLGLKKKLREKDQECQLKILKIKELKGNIANLQRKGKDEENREGDVGNYEGGRENYGSNEGEYEDKPKYSDYEYESRHNRNASGDYGEGGKEYYSKPKLQF
ncbi:unnamed protein product [Blepharisma stoltei]|uniref:Uncharacterized protein n=1 Tax=Blepharisma stoltei TaxID=1481888 RepID=A0AAU9IVC8_9CILI|nr:unnamed protein product [Blepharisma stoltei]